MPGPATIRSEHDLVEYLVSYARDIALGDEDPAVAFDRYHTPDVVWLNDGVRLDRDGLIAHARPARKNVLSCSVEVHSALLSGEEVAAHYTLSASLRNDRVLATEIVMVGRLAPDGRLQRIDQLTRVAREAAPTTDVRSG